MTQINWKKEIRDLRNKPVPKEFTRGSLEHIKAVQLYEEALVSWNTFRGNDPKANPPSLEQFFPVLTVEDVCIESLHLLLGDVRDGMRAINLSQKILSDTPPKQLDGKYRELLDKSLKQAVKTKKPTMQGEMEIGYANWVIAQVLQELGIGETL